MFQNQSRLARHNWGKIYGGPGAIRTRDLCLRRATLYPAELRVPVGGTFNGKEPVCLALNLFFFPFYLACLLQPEPHSGGTVPARGQKMVRLLKPRDDVFGRAVMWFTGDEVITTGQLI